MSVKPAHFCTLFFFLEKIPDFSEKRNSVQERYRYMRDPVPVHCAGTPQAESVGACQDLFFLRSLAGSDDLESGGKDFGREKRIIFMETEKDREADAKSILYHVLFHWWWRLFTTSWTRSLSQNADYLGSYGNAANTVVFPLTVVALSIAVMIGDGCCAFVSISLGAGKKEDAHRSIGNAIVLCIICSIILTAVI